VARRRRFEPSALVAGLLFATVAVVFGCDAAGAWHPKPVVVMFGECCGLAVVVLLRVLTRALRRREPVAAADPGSD
jgi:hypothetical protein